MSIMQLTEELALAGWGSFAPGEFCKIEFDTIGKAKVANNNWFALVKSIPVMNGADLDTWNQNYQDLLKQTRAGMFTSGKYFILILLIGTIGPDGLARLSQENAIGFLEMPNDITRGGGYTLMVLQDRKKVFMPKTVSLSTAMRATDFAKQTHLTLENYLLGLH